MEAVAKLRHLKGSPRKARLVIDLIRGRNVSQALSILKFTDKRAADPIAKTLQSAIANATYKTEQENIAIDPDDLWVKACFVDMGAHKNRRRMRPAPQGRAYREQRHYCHITIEVSSEAKPKTEKELKAEAAKAKRAAEGTPKKKATAKKAEAPKKEKKATKPAAEEVETPTPEAVAAEIPAQVETSAEAVDATLDSTAANTQENVTEDAEKQ